MEEYEIKEEYYQTLNGWTITPEEKYIYEDDEGNKQFDYCESCELPVGQEELQEGVFGCEHCKSANQITIFEVTE